MAWQKFIAGMKRKVRTSMMISLDIPMENVLFSKQTCYVKEGFGGKQLKFSPIYSFYDEYINSDKQEAFSRFCKWYTSLTWKYLNVSKQHGGMYRGSLYKLFQQNHEMEIILSHKSSDGDMDLILESIEQKVYERFDLADSIINSGYSPNLSDPIIAIENEGDYLLQNGHHRACILAVLGEKILPQVFVLKGKRNIFLYKLYEKTHYILRE